MPHVTFVPLTGFRVREPQLLELGMSLPGLRPRASAIAELPALGVLTLAGMTPEPWTCSYRGISEVSDASFEKILADQPDVVAISALTASIDEAYRLAARLRAHRIPTVIGGLHVSACPEEAEAWCDSVIVGRGESVWPQVLQDVSGGNSATSLFGPCEQDAAVADASLRSFARNSCPIYVTDSGWLPAGLRVLWSQPIAEPFCRETC